MATNRRKRAGKRAGSYRMCIGCRARLEQGASLRCVRGPDGQVEPDLFGKLPGRGVHLCPDLACFRRAVKHRAFSHALRAPTCQVEPEQLCRRFLDAARSQVAAILATSARSGWLVRGRTAVRDALRDGRVGLVLLALDASPSLQREMQARCSSCRVICSQQLRKQELVRFHHGKPLAVLGIRHRGIARRLAQDLAKMDRLETSMSTNPPTPPIRLTQKSVHGKMPPHRTGSRVDRS